MKRVFNCGKKHKAFSMAEMLVVMLILAIVIISMTPVAVKRVKKESVNPDHGSYECFYEPSGEVGKYNLIQRMRNAQGDIVNCNPDNPLNNCVIATYDVNANPLPPPPTCTFTAPRGAMFFVVNAVGGGSPGTGSVDAFSGLPEGAKHSTGSKSYAGVNYINAFNQFRSLLLDTSKDNVVSINGATYGSVSTSGTPAYVINNSGINLYAFLRSGGGILDNSTGGGYVVKKINTDYCAYDPDWSEFKHEGNGVYTVKECKKWNTFHTKCNEYYAGNCAQVNVFLGTNPKPGSAVKFDTTVKDGSPIYSNGGGDTTVFAAGNRGCKVGVGENGCYGSCNPAAGKVENYSSAMTCPTASSSRSVGGGIPSLYSTITSYTNFTYTLSDYCVPSGSSFVDSSGNSCTPKWSIEKLASGVGSWRLYTVGNLVLVRKKSSKGVNFYAQAGNPGEFRTLYVSRFAKSVTITPGVPKKSINTTNSEVGNDTVMKYSGEGGLQLLRVPGGKRAVATSESLSNTFIVGNLFNLPLPANPRVIAYDNSSGDNSGNLSEYGGYFREKDSSFIYPVPDAQHKVPDNVGQGGHGSYTIYRSSGYTEGYRVWKVQTGYSAKNEWDSSKTYSWVRDLLNTASTSGAARSGDAYTCVSNHKTLSGDEPRPAQNNNSYRCYAGDGQGGAVVITW